MEFITLEEAKRLSFIPVELEESNHAKFGKLETVTVYFQDWDDWGNLAPEKKTYYLLKK